MRYRYTSESIPQSRSASQPPLHKGALDAAVKRPSAATQPAARGRCAARTRVRRIRGKQTRLRRARADGGIGPYEAE